MLFQIQDIDYTLVNEKPVIRIFGKNEKGETVCGFYEDYMPYFYAMGGGLEDKVKGEANVIGIEKVKRYLPIGYQTKMTDMFKIILQNPARTPELRDKLINLGYRVFEADIPFKYRFMSDFGLKGIDWVDAFGSGKSMFSYTHLGEGIGTILEPNSDQITLEVFLQPEPWYSVDLKGRFARHGNASDGYTTGDGSYYDTGYNGSDGAFFDPGGARIRVSAWISAGI